MMKAASTIGDETGFDMRDAARRAARRDGVSLREWLDSVKGHRAEALGVRPADLDAEACLDAISDRLSGGDDRRPEHFVSVDRALAGFETDQERSRARRSDPAGKSVHAPDSRPAGVSKIARLEGGMRKTLSWIQHRLDQEMDERQPPESPRAASSGSVREGSRMRQGERMPAGRSPRDGAEAAAPRGAGGRESGFGFFDADAEQAAIEAKLNALFKALDRGPTPARPPASATLAAEPGSTPSVLAGTTMEPPASPAYRFRSTALSSAFSLDQAVAAISERQAFLDRAAGDAAASRTAAETASGTRRSFRSTPEPKERVDEPSVAAEPVPVLEASSLAEPTPVEPPTPAVEAPAPAAVDGAVASIFASLQADIGRMSSRLDAMHRDATRREPVEPAADVAFDEIRSMLERMRPDRSIDALEQRVSTLTTRIDKAIEIQLQPEAIAQLAQRIEEVQQSLAERLAADAATATDTGAIEVAVRELVGSVTTLQHDAADMRALEDMVRRLDAKLDEREPQVDAALFGELQGQVAKLAERIDRSDAGLSAIVAVERSMGELFSQMEETRDAAINAAENAARTAARDTLRSAMTEAGAPLNTSHRAADAAVEQVRQELGELRTARDVADKRLYGILGALNMTLEKVVDRLGALEDEGFGDEIAPAAQGPDRSAAPAPSPAINPLNAAHRSRPIPAVEANAVPIAPPRRPAGSALSPAIGDADFLIEPSAPELKTREAKAASDAPLIATPAGQAAGDPTDFIAAARRAAQSAAKDAATRASGAATDRARSGGLAAASMSTAGPGTKATVSAKRRPLLLVLAGVLLLMGAVQVARLALSPSSTQTASLDGAAVPTVTAPAVPPVDKAPAADVAAASPAPTALPAPVVAATPEALTATTDQDTPKPVAVAPPAKSLPTLAMGPAANLAAVSAGAPTGIAAGLRELAQDGNAAAQYEMGLRLADGRGTTRDLKGAADWFEKAAKQGLAPAAYRLGSLYEKGLGVAKDPATSIGWYQKAADAGNVRAMHNLAVMSAEGANGKSDYAKAASWFTKAAEAGVRDSQFNLAILYARGLGIEQNLTQSYKWFSIAAAQGDADAAKKRDEVAPRLDAAALDNAKKAAAAFQALPTVAAANEVPPPAGGWDALMPHAAATTKGSAAKVSSM